TTQANVTGLIAGLERAGMISRRGGTDDRRVSFVRLSGAGRKLVRGLLPEYFALQRSALRTLSASEKKTLVALLAKVAHGFQGAVEA
ncbi:MAG: MarR family winged helix-turn-helix transcriptional regulator, partial [Vulcanimicrobiaceae bacterium]